MSLSDLAWDSFVAGTLWQWLSSAIESTWWAKAWPILLDKGLLAAVFLVFSFWVARRLEKYKVSLAFHVELNKHRTLKVVDLWNSLAEQESYLFSESDRWHRIPEEERTDDALAVFIERLEKEMERHSIAIRKASLFVGRGVSDEANKYTVTAVELMDDLVKGSDEVRERAKDQLWVSRQRLLDRVLLLANEPLEPPRKRWWQRSWRAGKHGTKAIVKP